jgi:hypothetical protein
LVLRGRLSNPDFKVLLQSLTNRKQRKDPARNAKPAAGSADGRRKFGSVGDAVVAVLADAGGEMRLRDTHAAVEQRLGGAVSLFSVADFLLRRSKGQAPLFVHSGYGRYRLLG